MVIDAGATDKEKHQLRSYVAREATESERDAFLKSNASVLSERAKDAFLEMTAKDQYRCLQGGPITECQGSRVTEVLYSRVTDFMEMEKKVRSLAGAGEARVHEVPRSSRPVTGIVAAVAQQMANPVFDEVPEDQRRCSGAAVDAVPDNGRPGRLTTGGLEGSIKGVEGVIEALAKKYGMQKGERARVISENKELWKVQGDRTLPKSQIGVGWKWVIKGEAEEAKRKAVELERRKRVKQLMEEEKKAEEEKQKKEEVENRKEERRKNNSKKALKGNVHPRGSRSRSGDRRKKRGRSSSTGSRDDDSSKGSESSRRKARKQKVRTKSSSKRSPKGSPKRRSAKRSQAPRQRSDSDEQSSPRSSGRKTKRRR